MWDDWCDAFAEVVTVGSALSSEFCSAQINSSGEYLALLDAFSVMMVFLESILTDLVRIFRCSKLLFALCRL